MHLQEYLNEYKSKKQVEQALKENKDFLLMDCTSRWYGKPINLPQIVEEGVETVYVRYKDKKKICKINISKLQID